MRKNSAWFRREYVLVAVLGLVLILGMIIGKVAWLVVLLTACIGILMHTDRSRRSRRCVIASMAEPLVRLDYQYSPSEYWVSLWCGQGRIIWALFALFSLGVIGWTSDLMGHRQQGVFDTFANGFLICAGGFLLLFWMRAQYRRRNDTEPRYRGVFTMSAEGFVASERWSEESAVPWASIRSINVVDDAVYFRWFLGTSVIHPAAFTTPEDREAFVSRATEAWKHARAH